MRRKLASFHPHCAYALFRPASTACRRSSRRAACRASLPYSGLQAQLAGVQAGARHAAQACPIPACKHSLQAFTPARGMPRKLAGFHPIAAHSTPSN